MISWIVLAYLLPGVVLGTAMAVHVLNDGGRLIEALNWLFRSLLIWPAFLVLIAFKS